MVEDSFKKPPIIEALVEIRWKLKEKTPAGNNIDPHYQFLLGTFFEKIKTEYPFHEPLPTSTVPDEITGRMVKHRFRVAENDWPLVQIGPGIITVNETKKYGTFEQFKPKAVNVVNALFDSHPNKEDLEISSLQLRYIDAVEFDYSESNICDFLNKKMHIPSEIPSFLLLKDKIEKMPVSHSLKTSLRCNDPAGVASLTVSTGHKIKQRAVIWNQILESKGADVPNNMPDDFTKWIVDAHDVIDAWFRSIIKGNLEQEFNSE